ncbi:MAG: hypothetical protein LAT84_06780 [Balneolia bacterium]|nr:hypothetical protein [Balneolia bacterium]
MNPFPKLSDLSFIAIISTAALFACTEIHYPDTLGAPVVTSSQNLSCDFSVSPDERWIVLTELAEEPGPDPDRPVRFRKTLLFDIESGQRREIMFDAQTAELRDNGQRPEGLGCFNPESQKLYFSRTEMTGPRQVERTFFTVDLSVTPLTYRLTSEIECADAPVPEPPALVVEQTSDKEVRIFRMDGSPAAVHYPRSRFSRRIGLFAPDDPSWKHSFTPSKDGKFTAYRISETGLLGFSAPSSSYVIRIDGNPEDKPVLIGTHTYEYQWTESGRLYTCANSSSDHRRAIYRWDRDQF